MNFGKKVILLSLLVLTVSVDKSFAITPEETTDSNYMHAQGYSKETARIVNLQKKQVMGTSSEKKHSFKFINFIKKQFNDPDLTLTGEDFGETQSKYK